MAAPPLLDETYNAANTPKKFSVLIRPRRAPGSLTKMFLILAPAAAGANMWKTLASLLRRTLFCAPRFPQICTTTTTTTCFYCKKEKAQKPLALFAARAPPSAFWRRMRKSPNRSHHRMLCGIKPRPPLRDAPMDFVASPAMNCGQIGRAAAAPRRPPIRCGAPCFFSVGRMLLRAVQYVQNVQKNSCVSGILNN